MKKLICTIMAVVMIVSVVVFAKEESGKDKVLYLVEMQVKMPVGGITAKGLAFERKEVELRGILEVTTGYLVNNNKDDFTTAPKLVKTQWHWISRESFRLYEQKAIEINEFNRRMGKSTREFSYVTSLDVTSTFSAIGENKSNGGITWQFPISRISVRNTRAGDEFLNLSKSHFGYGLDNITVVMSGIAEARNSYLEEAEGVMTLVCNNCLADTVKSFTTFNGLQQQNHVNNVMRPCGVGTFKMHRIAWSASFKQDLEQYFYDKYDYSDVEVLDRLTR